MADSLHRSQMNNMILSALRKKLGEGRNAQQHGGQFQLRPTEMMSSSLPSAGESQAFNERKKNRALYGKYGKGGLAREELGQKRKKDAVDIARGMRKEDREERKLQETIRANKAKEKGGFGLGADQKTIGSGFTGGPMQKTGPSAIPGQAAAPVLQQAAAPDGGGTFSYGKGPGAVAGRIPGEYDPKWQPSVKGAAQGSAKASPITSKPPVNSKAKKKRPTINRKPLAKISRSQAAGQTFKDMFIRAPLKAIGSENVSALADTAYDMFGRSPWSAMKRGSKWLSRQTLGGLR